MTMYTDTPLRQGNGEGDVAVAKAALRRMNRISRGVDSGDENDTNAMRISRSGEVTVVRSGKRFIVRKTARAQIVELGRYNTLSEALSSLTSNATPTASGGTQRRNSKTAEDEDELWCLYCMDDPSITVCGFCGCRVSACLCTFLLVHNCKYAARWFDERMNYAVTVFF